MLFLLALLFFLLSTSVTAFPVYQYPDPLPIPPTALAFVADPVDQRDLPLRHFGCWTPIVSERCSFNVTSLEPLTGQDLSFCVLS
jgi:hypothetical protein